MRFLTALACVMVVLSVGAGARSQESEPDLDMGARLVKARCTACHVQNALPELVERCVGGLGEEYLDTFLRTHHAPDDDARADIIAFLTCDKAE